MRNPEGTRAVDVHVEENNQGRECGTQPCPFRTTAPVFGPLPTNDRELIRRPCSPSQLQYFAGRSISTPNTPEQSPVSSPARSRSRSRASAAYVDVQPTHNTRTTGGSPVGTYGGLARALGRPRPRRRGRVVAAGVAPRRARARDSDSDWGSYAGAIGPAGSSRNRACWHGRAGA